MKKFLLSLLLLSTNIAFGALTEVDKAFYSEKNLLPNPGFESGKSGWVSSSATFSATTTAANVLHGAASGSILITSNGGYVRSKTVALPIGLQNQACEASVYYRGGDALATLEVYNRDNTLLGSQVLRANTIPGVVSAFFPCPTASEVAGDADKGFIYTQIKQTTAGTHAVLYADNWFLGKLQNLAETTLSDLFSAKISSTGVVSSENNDFFNGNCSIANTNEFTCTFVSSLFSAAPLCVGTSETASATNGVMVVVNSISTSTVVFETVRHDANATATDMHIHCMKAGVDAKQTIQVYKSIPKTSEVINSFTAKISSTDVVSDENVEWITGDCTDATSGEQTCTFAASTFVNTPNCGCTTSTGGVNDMCNITAISSSAVTLFSSDGGTGTGINNNTVLSCSKAGSDFKLPLVQPIFSPASIVGAVVQSAYTQTGALASGSTTVPQDDTIPQNTEGVEFMTLAITPKSATNLLRIKAVGNFSYSTGAVCNMALFQDSTANALASTLASIVASNGENMSLIHTMVAGTTSATTFKIRAGCGTAGTITFNGIGGGRYYGGTMASSITIEEVQQ